MDVYIYGLVDPGTSEVRYVGKTIDLKQRLRKHSTRLENNRKASWIKNLKSRGLSPEMVVLDVVTNSDDSDWQHLETWWITYLRFLGCKLTNLNGGGQGGVLPSEETRRRMSEAHVGKVMPDSVRRKLSAAHKGVPKPEGFSEKLRIANTGKTHSSITRSKLAENARGRFTPEHQAKMIEAARTPEAVARNKESVRQARKRPEVIRSIKEGIRKRSKPVEQLTLAGDRVAVFESTVQAGRVTGLSSAQIGSCARGRKYFKTAGGFVWKFCDLTNHACGIDRKLAP